jgi:hypothetical protein
MPQSKTQRQCPGLDRRRAHVGREDSSTTVDRFVADKPGTTHSHISRCGCGECDWRFVDAPQQSRQSQQSVHLAIVEVPASARQGCAPWGGVSRAGLSMETLAAESQVVFGVGDGVSAMWLRCLYRACPLGGASPAPSPRLVWPPALAAGKSSRHPWLSRELHDGPRKVPVVISGARLSTARESR